jgi:hypothetical protein
MKQRKAEKVEVRLLLDMSKEKGKVMVSMRINSRYSFAFAFDRIVSAYYHAAHERDAWERLACSLESASAEYFGAVGSDLCLGAPFFLEMQKSFVLTPSSVRSAIRAKDSRGKPVYRALPARKGGWGGERVRNASQRLSEDEVEELSKVWKKAVQEAAETHNFMKYALYVDVWRKIYARPLSAYPPMREEKRFYREVHALQKQMSQDS